MKILTLFTPGSYGTFISWCVYSFSELNQTKEIVSSVSEGGSGHRFRATEGYYSVTPHHWVVGTYENCIIIECDKRNLINYMDNQLEKQYLKDIPSYIESFFPNHAKKLSQLWGGSEPWQLRELLSFFLGEMMLHTQDQINLNHQQAVSLMNCYTINPEYFLLNPIEELDKLLKFFNLKKHKKFDLVDFYVNQYISQQRNFTKSEEIEKFIQSTLDETSYIIKNLTIVDEAYIQLKLRSYGKEILCYNLNNFPTDSIDLVKLLE